MKRTTLVLLLVTGCAHEPTPTPTPTPTQAPSTAALAVEAEHTPPTSVAVGQEEPITVINTMPIAVEVSVVATTADGQSTEVRFGPIQPESRQTEVVRVQLGGSLTVQAHWTLDDQPRQSNPLTANLLSEPITPVTLTLTGLPTDRPRMAQWSSVVWDEP